MTQPPTTRLHLDPPIDVARITPRNGRTSPVIATGHQPYLWHPGILAKDLAADAIANRLGGSAIHIIVEHNAIAPLAIDLPTVQGNSLGVRKLVLDDRFAAQSLPPNRLAPLDSSQVVDRLSDAVAASHDVPGIVAPLDQIAKAYAQVGDHEHLADQTAAILDELKRPYLAAPMRNLTTRGLVTQGFVDRLLADPVGCVRCYNRAAMAFPEAGIRPLFAGRDVVEVPLWAQGDAGSTPVYIDLGDSRHPQFFTQGQSLDLTGDDALQYLRPRAAALSAIMRSERCDLFIHGTGGGVYDQVTEQWWHDWVGESLSPMAVVSADVYLPLDAPTATPQQLEQAVWFDHHLPFNVDRHTPSQDDGEAALIAEKRELLRHMNDDADKRRRYKAFNRIHAINAQLRAAHGAALMQAQELAEAARIGVSNAAIARRRDWCFALYSENVLQGLAAQIKTHLDASP